MSAVIGIDFGTTNSLISVVLSNRVRSFTENDLPHPSVVCYTPSGVICGREAKDRIESLATAESEGIIRSPKTLLGNEVHHVLGREVDPVAIVAELMKYLKEQALAQSGARAVSDFDRAVVSIPVSMDGRRRAELRDALLDAGINIVQFVHEPLAALYAHFRDTDDSWGDYSNRVGELALVFDWGGGTLDLTLCQIGRDSISQIANLGDNEVGGDFIDQAIVNYVIEQHTRQHDIDSAVDVNPGARSKLVEQCERAKMGLSERDAAFIYVPDYYALEGDQRDIEYNLQRQELEDIASGFIRRGLGTIEQLLGRLNLDQRRISLCLATGGMINMPTIRDSLLQIFGADRLHVSQRGDRIISEGCAWIAHDNAGLKLAKRFEVVEARSSYLPVFKEGDLLPIEGDVLVEDLIMYCVDPRDGKAKFQFVRPRHLGKRAASDPRDTFTNLTVKVDKDARPFFERIDLRFMIDSDLIITVEARSASLKDVDREEIHDLEFALDTSSLIEKPVKAVEVDDEEEDEDEDEDLEYDLIDEVEEEGMDLVCARSNVTSQDNSPELVPGELLYEVDRHRFDLRNPDPLPDISHEEKLFYQPCSGCGRRANHPDCNCSSTINQQGPARIVRTRARL